MERLVKDIERLAPLDDIKQQIDRHRSEVIRFRDENNLDILHHAIMINFVEVVRLLFLKGLFLEPHQPVDIGYLHLACYLGRTAIVIIILQERPGDFRKTKFVYPHSDDMKVNREDICPTELAALSGHIRCIEILLERLKLRHFPNYSLLECAIETNLPQAVELLLQKTKPNQTEIDKALKEAVRRKQANCIDMLLQHGANPSTTFNGLNLYHSMYMYSSAYQVHTKRNEGLSNSTSVLIKHGIDINSHNPPGSYPLYSLITSLIKELEIAETEPPVEHFRCLEKLLAAKADPNFNEVVTCPKGSNKQGVFGREKSFSALHALFLALIQVERWNVNEPQEEDYVNKACQILIKHGANLKTVNSAYETPLHHLMACLAVEHGTGALKWNLGPTLHLLLVSGADPNQSPWHPINVYFDALWECSCHEISQRPRHLQQALSLLYFMDYDSIQEAMSLLNTVMETRPPPEQAIKLIREEVDHITQQVKSLLFSCRVVVWKYAHRKKENVSKLPLPTEIKSDILSIFDIVL